MNCLYCHEEILEQIGWSQLFSREEKSCLCCGCQEQLSEIKGETCRTCCRPFDSLETKYITGDICYDCHRWEEDPEWKGCLEKNYSIYDYNDFIKEILSQFKFRGDYVLAKCFATMIKNKLEVIPYDILTTIPLSSERMYERGFNQADALVKEAGFQPFQLLKRTYTEKQSKKSRYERIHHNQVFELTGVSIQGKKILLIDDIYTTGSTLRHAAKILRAGGVKSVVSLTLARG